MADQRSVVELVFQGVDQTSEATRAALNNAEQFSSSVGNITAPIADFTKDAVKFELALLGAGAAITALSIVAAGDFDAAFREISTLIDEPTESLGDFRREILQYAATSTQSLPQITSAVYSAISAGVEYTDSLQAVATAERLAVAGKADLEQALIVLVSSLNAYNLTMDEAESFSDALFQAVKDGQTTLSELGSTLARVTGTAASLEVPFEVLLAAISTLTATGMPTNQAITAINAALNAMLNPSQQARQQAEALGIEFGAQAVKANGLEAVLQEVARATGGNEEQMARLFGSTQALAAVFPLTGAAADRFAESIANQANNAGATEEAYERMAGAIGLSNRQIMSSFQMVLIAIGDPLLAEYGNVANAIVAIFNAIGTEIEEGELGGIVDAIRDIMADAAEAFLSLAENIPEVDFSQASASIVAGVSAIADAVRQLFQSLDLGTPEGLQRAIEALGLGFQALSEFTAGTVEQLSTFIGWVAGQGVEGVLEFAQQWANTAGKIGMVAIAINTLLPLLTALLSGVNLVLAAKLALPAAASGAGIALTGLAVKLGPAGAVAVALGNLIYQLDRIVRGLQAIREANERAESAQESMAISAENVAASLERISATTGLTVSNMDEFHELVKAGTIALNEQSNQWELVTEEVRDYDQEVRDALRDSASGLDAINQALKDYALESGLAYDEATGAIGTLAGALGEAEGATGRAAGATQGWIEYIGEDGERAFRQLGNSIDQVFDDAVDAIEDVINTSEEYRIRMREIAAEEYIATIQAQVELESAILEAETRRIEAAFESINTSIISTGEVIGGIVGLLDGASGRTRLTLEEQLRRENAIREDAARLQRELTEAQIESLRERTRRMQSGGALIEVEGSGLQPHLEAFMWEILRSIQLRVNEDGLDMLLGVEA
jgi:TP901 family phage tail tape measure protein